MANLSNAPVVELPREPVSWQQELQQELERYVTLLVTYYDPEKIILFGSLAHGQTRLWSDIDLVVVTHTNLRFLERMKEALLLLRPQVGLDLLIYTPDEFEALSRERPFFQQEIMNGKVVYERSR